MNLNAKNVVKIAGVSAVGIVGGFAAGNIFTRELVSLAMDREESEMMKRERKRIHGDPIYGEFFEKSERKAKKLREKKHESVILEKCDGLKLKGHVYGCENAERTFLMMHGWRSNWATDFALQAEYLMKLRANLIFAEERAQGESDGEYITFGILEREDARDWAKYASRKFPGKPIYLYGVSMGATSVLMSGELDLPAEVSGIIADCAYTSPGEIWEHILKNRLHIPKGVHGKLSEKLCEKKISVGTSKFSTEKALKKCNVPVLFVHGASDRIVPVEMTYRNAEAFPGKKRMLIVPGADHAMSYIKDRMSYEKELHDFITQ